VSAATCPEHGCFLEQDGSCFLCTTTAAAATRDPDPTCSHGFAAGLCEVDPRCPYHPDAAYLADLDEERRVKADAIAEPPGRRLVAVTADTLKMKAPRWLHDWRIPTGAITLIAGREGIGKSTISHDLAALITRGKLPGRYLGTPRGVAVVAGEDSWECVILPRLVAAGADLSRVHRVEAREDGHADAVSVPADLARLAQLCAEKDIVLVILDPLMSVIHGSLDTHKDREVRQALDPLVRFATDTGVAVLGLIHVNKTATTDPLTSMMASRAFPAVARSVLYCLLDPDAEREDRYLFGHAKSNLGPKQPTLRYHLLEVKLELEDGDEPVIVTSRVVWDGVDERTIRDAMETATRTSRPVGELATELEAWLTEQARTVSSAEIAASFPTVKRSTLDKNLGRMVERGTITRPVYGHYVIKQSDAATLTPSLETSQASEVSEVSDHLTGLTDLTSDTSPREVSDPLSGWAASAYDRER